MQKHPSILVYETSNRYKKVIQHVRQEQSLSYVYHHKNHCSVSCSFRMRRTVYCCVLFSFTILHDKPCSNHRRITNDKRSKIFLAESMGLGDNHWSVDGGNDTQAVAFYEKDTCCRECGIRFVLRPWLCKGKLRTKPCGRSNKLRGSVCVCWHDVLFSG